MICFEVFKTLLWFAYMPNRPEGSKGEVGRPVRKEFITDVKMKMTVAWLKVLVVSMESCGQEHRRLYRTANGSYMDLFYYLQNCTFSSAFISSVVNQGI